MCSVDWHIFGISVHLLLEVFNGKGSAFCAELKHPRFENFVVQ
jgi:hypothetical protein